MPHLHVSETLKEQVHLIPKPDRCHYIKTVMRAKKNDPVAVFNSRDGDWLARIVRADKKKVELLVLSRIRPSARPSTIDPWLLFAPLKKECTDIIVQKATELGVRVLWPVITQRTNTRRVNESRLAARHRSCRAVRASRYPRDQAATHPS